MEVKTVVSEKGKQLLIVNGYTYYEKRTLKSDEIVWQCSADKRCTAKVYTQMDKITVSRCSAVHLHDADEKKINQKILNNSAKRKAEDILERPSKIIHSVITENSSCLESLTTKDVSHIRRNIYNARRKQMSTLPKNRDEAIMKLEEMSLKTVKDENFLLAIDRNTGIVVFSCTSNLMFLCKCKTVYMDGTFKYCTKFWLQLFTIHAIENGHYVPIAFCLLPDKKEETYSNLFNIIVDKCCEKQFSFRPERFVVDFEMAIHNAIHLIWPYTPVQGCKFHLAQAWHRKIQKLGLSTEFRQWKENDIGKWLKNIFGLSYLNPDDVGDCFAFSFAENQPTDPKVTAFVDYLIQNYIEDYAKFPPNMWAKADASSENTTNACESFHAHFNKCFYQTHPNLHVFIEILKQFQIDSYIKMASTDQIKVNYSKVDAQRRKNLDDMIKKYLTGAITKMDLVKFASFKASCQ